MKKSQPPLKDKKQSHKKHHKFVLIVGTSITAATMGAIFILSLVHNPQKMELTTNTKPPTTSQEAPQSTEQQIMNTDTSQTQNTPQTPSNELTQQQQTQPEPEPQPEPVPIDQFGKQYPMSQGESEQQAVCFSALIAYRTGWSISEDGIKSKYASIKENYPSMCAAHNIAMRHPKDTPLKGM